MAECNDYSFRSVCRKHSVKLCWTGFIDVHRWINEPEERAHFFHSKDDEQGLICQLLGSDETELKIVLHELEAKCDMIELNFGCTHWFASKHGCGFFMVDTKRNRERTLETFSHIVEESNIPIGAKIRIISGRDGLPSRELTIEFAKALEKVGAAFLTLHCRGNGSDKTGDPDWGTAREVATALTIPVIVNGGIGNAKDAQKAFDLTGAAAVMAGQALMNDFTCFDNIVIENEVKHSISIAREYLNEARKNDEWVFYVRKHMFAMLGQIVRKDKEIPPLITAARTFEAFNSVIDYIESKYSQNQ